MYCLFDVILLILLYYIVLYYIMYYIYFILYIIYILYYMYYMYCIVVILLIWAYGVVVSMFDFHCSDRGSNPSHGSKMFTTAL